MIKPSSNKSIFLGLLLTAFLNLSSSSERSYTYEIKGLTNKANHQYSLINERNIRFKRDVNDQPKESLVEKFTKPLNSSEIPEFPVEIENTQNSKNVTTDNHTYYNVTYYTSQPEITNQYWINMKEVNSSRHEMLSNAHRRAATFRLSFKFPFYGYKIENITIATGGFVFLGEAVHAWLAATQYVAPLMANFNTSINPDSSIYFFDNKTAFTVQWENVYLQDASINSTIDDKQVTTKIDKPFSFQATLKDNGDIIFVYKQIPYQVSKINEEKHPVKVGISDAYLIDRTIFFIRRKTIYEYHKAELKNKSITNNTVIYFKALPTCNSLSDCNSCLSKLSSSFDCSWCESTKKCSDGYDRHRQEWLKSRCDDNAVTKCSSNNGNIDQLSKEGHILNEDTLINTSSKPLVPIVNTNDINNSVQANQEKLKGKSINGKDQNKSSRKSGFATLFILMVLIVMVGYWAMYAYRNPQSKAGQLIIKYRPAQWRFNNSDNRYATEFGNLN